MNRDDDPQLWDLLGKSAPPQVSSFFARNVVREIRKMKSARWPFLAWLNLRWLAPAAGVAAVLIAGVLAIHQPPARNSVNSPVVAKADLDDDVAADLDDLVASDDEADDDDAGTTIR
ncbi:MAG: hypothetical protein ACJ8IQ_08480 [Chthoniobacterales bacterium]